MKKIPLLLLSALLLLALSGCGTKDTDPSGAAEQTYTGVLDEKKDFMIIVEPEDGGDACVFQTEGVQVDAKVGDTVTVTYTGDIDDVTSLLEATKVETAA